MTLIRNLKAHAALIFFLIGFLFDAVTINRVDDLFSVMIFIFYLGLSFLCLKFQRDKANYNPHPFMRAFIHYENEIFHFAQGSLLSAFAVIYIKSASLTNCFIFLIFFSILLIANEIKFIQRQDKKLKALLFHFTSMSFFLVYIPSLFGFVNTWVTIFSVFIFILFSFIVHKNILIGSFFTQARLVAGSFLMLYLLGITPPVPLSLKFAGIYHHIEKKYPEYILHDERPWWRFWHNGDQFFMARPGDKIYFFTRIFAPQGFNNKLFVRWKFLINDEYQTSDRIPLTIMGGRDGGYRGFTYKKNYPSGKGIVFVETTDGKEVGRLSFQVKKIKDDL